MGKKIKKIFRWIGRAILLFFVLSIVTVLLYKFIPVPITPLMLQRLPEQAFGENRSMRLKKEWVSLDKISPNIQLAVVCAEDQKFLDHFGFDIEAIKKAAANNQKSKKIKGASTISQQTAKNVFLLPVRSYIRKGLEVYFTFLIELMWSKERILEVYLNVIELGDGIYGAGAGANYYFHKNAAQLTPSEAALMAAVLPNPLKYKVDKPGRYEKRRQKWILRQMAHWGWELDFDKNELNKEEDEPEDE